MKPIFLVNPAGGSRGRQAELAGVCRKAALEQNLEYEILVTEHPGHGVELVRKACLQGGGEHRRFYAGGGDGPLNEVARGALGMWNGAVGHFPAGTGNDFIKVFGRQMNRFSHLPELTKGEELPVDYVETNCGGAVNVLSVGIDARVAAGMRKYKRLPLCRGQWPYVFSAAENIVRGLGEGYQVIIDGKSYDGDYSMIFAANGRWYGGGFCPVPDADPQDGQLDVLLVSKVGRMTAAKVVGAYKKGLGYQYPQYIKRVPAHEIEIRRRDGKDLCVNLDGEIAYTPRLQAVLRQGMKFIVPQGVRVEKQDQ